MYYPKLNTSVLTYLIASVFLILLSNVYNLTLELVAICDCKEQNATCQLFLSNYSSEKQRLALNYRWLVIPQIITSSSQYLLFLNCGVEFLVPQCLYARTGLIIGATCTTNGASFGLL